MDRSYGIFDVRKFGAQGDGITDDTDSFNAAVSAAAEVQGIVFIPPGNYLVGEIQAKTQICFQGAPHFKYRVTGGSVLHLNPEKTSAKCLLNLTGTYGCQVKGLCLCGNGIKNGNKVHGIMIDKKDYGKEEDNPLIDSCRIEKFSGDAIHLERIWCFSVRHTHCFKNGGCGLRIRGWDGFILDNWFSRNGEAGIGCYDENASNTLTGNRIEWNCQCGIFLRNASMYNITGNYIDRSGHEGIHIENSRNIAMTGNVIYRSGKPEWTSNPERSAHFSAIDCCGISFTGNTLAIGRDDGGRGELSPVTGIILRGNKNSVIANNTLNEAALQELICAEGNCEDCIIRDNPGCIHAG